VENNSLEFLIVVEIETNRKIHNSYRGRVCDRGN
jgi:hypothetical protein